MSEETEMSGVDHETYRSESAQQWEEAASGWLARQQQMRAFAAPVSAWMVDAIAPRPGGRILELAAGIGDTGFLAAERVLPDGHLITSDRSQGMLDGARARAEELGLSNVQFKLINAESIDLPVAAVDGVLCRWAYMLMADPTAALTETRRVLTPDGRIALAVWDTPAANPWLTLPTGELVSRGIVQTPAPGTPGPLALADPEAISRLLADAGFTDIEVTAIDLSREHPDFEDFWETTLDMSRSVHDAVMDRSPAEIAAIREAIATALSPFAAPDGSLRIPARALLAAASA